MTECEQRKNNGEVDLFNKAGVALPFGFIGIVVIGLAFEIQNKKVLFVIALILVFIGYFGIVNRLFKNDRNGH